MFVFQKDFRLCVNNETNFSKVELFLDLENLY